MTSQSDDQQRFGRIDGHAIFRKHSIDSLNTMLNKSQIRMRVDFPGSMCIVHLFNEDSSAPILLATRSDEVDVRKLSQEHQKLFDESDQVEWNSVPQTKAVRVVVGKEAGRLYFERALSSRMARRRKPQPRVGCWKAKSRWCIHGHSDPDTAELMTFAPTPSTEGTMAFLMTGLNLGHAFSFCDVKNAFRQSDRLQRKGGPLFAEPCEGLHLPPGALIVIEAPIYNLHDAPAASRATGLPLFGS